MRSAGGGRVVARRHLALVAHARRHVQLIVVRGIRASPPLGLVLLRLLIHCLGVLKGNALGTGKAGLERGPGARNRDGEYCRFLVVGSR